MALWIVGILGIGLGAVWLIAFIWGFFGIVPAVMYLGLQYYGDTGTVLLAAIISLGLGLAFIFGGMSLGKESEMMMEKKEPAPRVRGRK